jgi:hypothetical protein
MSETTIDIEIPFDQRLVEMFESQGLEVAAESRVLLREGCLGACAKTSDAWRLFNSIERVRAIRVQCELDFRTIEPCDIRLGYALFACARGPS